MSRVHYVLAAILVVAALGASIIFYPLLPETVPTHWDIHGRADDYSRKAVALLLMPALMAATIGLFQVSDGCRHDVSRWTRSGPPGST